MLKSLWTRYIAWLYRPKTEAEKQHDADMQTW